MTQNQIKYLDPVFISKLKNVEIKARMIVEGFITGLHKSPYHGFSVEFAEHRPYNTGESLRNIDWKVFAKRDKLFTRRYEEETNLRCYVVLDVSDSMRYPVDKKHLSRLEYGAYLSAALAYLMVKQKDAVGFTLFDDAIRYYVPPKSRQSWLLPIYKKIEEVVETVELFTHRTATAQTLHQLAAKISRRGLVVIITDLFSNTNSLEDIFPALQHLRHENHEVLVFQLLDKETEVDFNFPNQPMILQDLETGEQIRIHPQHIKAEYVEIMTKYKENLLKKCRELNVDLIEVDIKKPYDKALTDYIIKRQALTR